MSERFIEAGASPFSKFQVGDSVAHIRIGDGEIIVNDGVGIRVEYRDGSLGIYDENWFREYPTWLFHRGTSADKNG